MMPVRHLLPFFSLWLGLVSCTLSPATPPPAEARHVAEKAYPKTPAEAVALKEAGSRWTNCEVRVYYNELVNGIAEVDAAMKQQGRSAEERAHAAFDIRHNARVTARAMMENEAEVALLRARDQEKYGNPDGPTFAYLVEKNRAGGAEGDAVYTAIIESSQRTDEKVNEECGIQTQ